jgi:hypothetical protein
MKLNYRKIIPVILYFGAAAALAQRTADVTPPVDHKPAFTLSATGDLSYECKAVADKPGTFAWTFAGPNATLWDAGKNAAGRYYAGPTWESADGSKVTGTQVAVAPGSAGAIPLQLVQATTATGDGMMAGVTYVQRVNTVGGIAPVTPACAGANVGARTTVPYSADYVFFKKA